MEIYSVSKALYHTEKIKELQQGKMIVPTMIQVDLEAWCNHNCNFCSYRKEDGYNNSMLKLIEGESHTENKPIGKMSDGSHLPLMFAQTLPEMFAEAGVPAVEITGGGEPTMWPRFTQVLEGFIDKGIEVGLVTNGSNLSSKDCDLIARGCKWLRISMDSSDQETHTLIHRTSKNQFKDIIERIMEVIKLREYYKRIPNENNEGLTIGISYIITPENADNNKDLEKAVKFYKELGVSNIRFSWQYDKSGNAGLHPIDIERISARLEELKEEYDTNNFRVLFERGRIETYSEANDFENCYYQRFVWNVGADGLIYPCCIMKYHPNFAIADLKEKTIKEVIEDINSKAVMENINPSKCFPCWLKNRNKAIAQAVEKPTHSNFV